MNSTDAATPAAASSLLFFDPVCQKPYDTETVRQAATGGTEATVTRIADSLGAIVMQHNRTTSCGDRYRPPGRVPGITHVIVNRDSRALARVRELFPDARVYLWVHHHFPLGSKLFLRLASTADLLRDMEVTFVCVSHQQRHDLQASLRPLDLRGRVKTCTIYNPVDDALVPDGSPIDESKLVFFSSPNKGLKFTLDAFRELRRRMPDLQLVVGNPGYKIRDFPPIEGVQYLGPQPQHLIHAQVRTALCLFFPNFVLPETFGLVLAESKALGTPVLTHDCGAAAEIVGDPQQLLPLTFAHLLYEDLLAKVPSSWRRGPARLAAYAGLFDCYADRIRAWRGGARPTTAPDPRFRLSTVVNEWRALLSG
jgi:glycosyltransferase involved in cell wall biosynthesis